MATKERPILFSGPMVRAILAGQKTETRRVVKFRPGFFDVEEKDDGRMWPWAEHPDYCDDVWMPCPYGQPGERLWVRETHAIFRTHGQHRADGRRWGPWGGLPTTLSEDGTQIAYFRQGFDRCDPGRWRPSIHMPRWACRQVLEITDVRVERLHAISAEDCIAEGLSTNLLEQEAVDDLRGQWKELWSGINGAASWDANPWVWVVEFKRVEAAA